jgi:hypothetical protein
LLVAFAIFRHKKKNGSLAGEPFNTGDHIVPISNIETELLGYLGNTR